MANNFVFVAKDYLKDLEKLRELVYELKSVPGKSLLETLFFASPNTPPSLTERKGRVEVAPLWALCIDHDVFT